MSVFKKSSLKNIFIVLLSSILAGCLLTVGQSLFGAKHCSVQIWLLNLSGFYSLTLALLLLLLSAYLITNSGTPRVHRTKKRNLASLLHRHGPLFFKQLLLLTSLNVVMLWLLGHFVKGVVAL